MNSRKVIQATSEKQLTSGNVDFMCAINKLKIPISLVLIFLTISFWNLHRIPTLHLDETSILEPGYSLFHTGQFNSPMYYGLSGREDIYLEVMPLMPFLQGLTTWFLGIGVWQLRVFPVLCGAMILVLTLVISNELMKLSQNHLSIAVVSCLLLLFWKWTPGNEPFLASGIGLIDVSRIGRYDILVPVFGLGSYLAWIKKRFVLSGILVGLAGLSNLYGFFWIAILIALSAGSQMIFRDEKAIHHIGKIFSGMMLTIIPWAIVLCIKSSYLIGQFSKHNNRFDLFDLNFYWSNIVHEINRYHFGINQHPFYLRIGFWVAIVGLPLCLVWLLWHFIKSKEKAAFYLLVPITILPFLLAILINEKKFYYLMIVMPLFAILLGWAITIGLRAPQQPWRFLTRLILGLIVVEGIISIGKMQITPVEHALPSQFFTLLQQHIPTDVTILGPQPYWLAFPAGNYRSIHLVFLLALQGKNKYVSLTNALEQISPSHIIVHPDWSYWFDTSFSSEGSAAEKIFWTFMNEHDARLVYTTIDYEGKYIQIYQLQNALLSDNACP